MALNSTSSPASPFPFMSLPAELRLQVYNYVACETSHKLSLPDVDVYYYDLDYYLLLDSRLIRQEAHTLFQRQRLVCLLKITIRPGSLQNDIFSVES